MSDGDSEIPRDAKIVKTLLKSMGVEEFEPRVIHQFLEFWYRYAVDILTDAQVYSEHAGKNMIDSDDVKLAIQSQVNSSFSQPPPREVMLELARNRNKIPLPKATPGPGIALPPEQDTLINPNYQLAFPRRMTQVMEEREEDEEGIEPNSSNANASTQPNSSQDQVMMDLPQRTQPMSFPGGPQHPR